MKKKKYDRPFVEVLTLETSNGMMAGSPGGGNGGTTVSPDGSEETNGATDKPCGVRTVANPKTCC